MTTVQVFDPAMCCSTGVCGPSVDPRLARFAADLDWLKTQGVSVERFNLAQQPAAFAEDASVRAALEAEGEAGLPLVKVNGRAQCSGAYPSRAELARWAGLQGPEPSVFTDSVAELVAIAAAIASNCEPCFKAHFDRARKLGVAREDMQRAVTIAKQVREAPAAAVLDLAGRYLGSEAAPDASKLVVHQPATSACCGPAETQPGPEQPAKGSGNCCCKEPHDAHTRP